MNAIIYSRVSTTLQEYYRQESALKEYCRNNSLTIVHEFAEKDSGLKRERPELTRMMNFIEENSDIDYLVIHETSRLGRTSKLLETIDVLNKKKIGLISLKENLRTLTPDKKVDDTSSMILKFLSILNGVEVDNLKYRAKSGIKESIKKGVSTGGVYYSYGYSKLEKQLIVNEQEAEVVKLIFNMYKKGNGTFKIATYLNDKNVPTKTTINLNSGIMKKTNHKQEWNINTVYNILKNPIYIGKRRYAIDRSKKEFEHFDLPHLRIIDDETFRYVNERLVNNYSKIGNNTKHSYFLDSQKVFCGLCGATFYRRKTKNDTINMYLCSSKRHIIASERCRNTSIGIDKLDKLVQHVILYKYEEILKTNLEDNTLKSELQSINSEIVLIDNELKKIQKQEENLVRLYTLGKVNDDVYDKMNNEIQNKQRILLNKLNVFQTKLNETKNSYKNITDVRRMSTRFFIKGTKLPKTAVNSMITKIIVLDVDKADINVKNALIGLQTNTIRNEGVVGQKIGYKYKNPIPHINYFTKKNDKVVLITLEFGATKLQYLISQREDFIYDVNDNEIQYAARLQGTFGKGLGLRRISIKM